MQSDVLSQSLIRWVRKSAAFQSSYIVQCMHVFPGVPLSELCSVTSGLIKVNQRTRSSGYTW